jgi:hypothetical protein
MRNVFKLNNYISRKWLSKCLILFDWFNAGSEVLTAVVIKNSVFWDITLKVNRSFGGTSSGSKKTPSNKPG